MNSKLDGIIIKTADYRDSDKIVTILSEKGKISAKAQGARRKSSRLTAAVQPFTYCSFQLFNQGGKYMIDEADVNIQFFAKNPDIVKIALASYFCEVAASEMEHDVGDDSLLRLMLNILYATEHELYSFERIKAAFEIKCTCLWGYMPTLAMAEDTLGEHIFVSFEDGHISSRNMYHKGCKVNKEVLSAINFICRADMKKLLSFKLEKRDEELLGEFARGYILDKMEYKPKTLDFYEGLLAI